jgi:hypothetical protein
MISKQQYEEALNVVSQYKKEQVVESYKIASLAKHQTSIPEDRWG